MNSLKDYIKLYRKFKTDAELAQDTGLSEQEVRSIQRQLNLESWMENKQKNNLRTGRP